MKIIQSRRKCASKSSFLQGSEKSVTCAQKKIIKKYEKQVQYNKPPIYYFQANLHGLLINCCSNALEVVLFNGKNPETFLLLDK